MKTVQIEQLDEGYVVGVKGAADIKWHRSAEATQQGALTIAARALGYRGVIRFDDEPRTVEVPVVGMARPGLGIPFDDEEPPLRAGTVVDPVADAARALEEMDIRAGGTD